MHRWRIDLRGRRRQARRRSTTSSASSRASTSAASAAGTASATSPRASPTRATTDRTPVWSRGPQVRPRARHVRRRGAFGAGNGVGEPLFVPRADDGAEDDGYVLVLAYDQARNASDFCILDARDIAGEPIATITPPPPRPVRLPRQLGGRIMRYGLNVGYSGARLAIDMDLVHEAERLGFHSVWTAEAYGSDAVTPLAWIGGQTRRIHLGTGDHADAGAHAGDDRDDRDDARPAVGRPLPPRTRRFGPAGGRGLARPALRQAAGAHARVRRDRAQDLGARGAARAPRRALPDPLPRPGRDRARQAAEEHPPRPADPDLHRRDRPEERRAGGRDRRRLAADLVLARTGRTSTRTRSRRASARRRRQVARQLRRRARRRRSSRATTSRPASTS